MAAELAVVGVSLASAFTFALSTSLKHASASQLAGEHNTRTGAWGRFVRATLTHPLWLGGIAADVLGLSLQVIALHLGALAIVQPLLISGLLFALILRQRSRHDASRREIGWGVLLTMALAGFLLLAGITNSPKPHSGINHWPPTLAVATGVLLAFACVQLGRKRTGGSSAALLGVAVGVTYAATAALLKAVTNIALRGPVPVLTSWQLYAVIASGAAGLLLNQVAFRAGPLTASLPAIATVDPLLSIAIGVLVYHEHLHHGPFRGIGLAALVVLMGVAAIQVSRAGQDSEAIAALRPKPDPTRTRRPLAARIPSPSTAPLSPAPLPFVATNAPVTVSVSVSGSRPVTLASPASPKLLVNYAPELKR